MRVILEGRGALGDVVLICQGTSTVDAVQPDDRRLEWLKLAQQEFVDFADFLVGRISEK